MPTLDRVCLIICISFIPVNIIMNGVKITLESLKEENPQITPNYVYFVTVNIVSHDSN